MSAIYYFNMFHMSCLAIISLCDSYYEIVLQCHSFRKRVRQKYSIAQQNVIIIIIMTVEKKSSYLLRHEWGAGQINCTTLR